MTFEQRFKQRQRAVEVVRQRLHNVLPVHSIGRDHAADLNAECSTLARWIVDDVIAALKETGQ